MMNYRLHSDEMLLQSLKESDAIAFKTIYERHWLRLYQLALGKVRHAEIAKDLVQQIFVSLWNRRDTLQISSLPAYLMTAVKYRCISHFASSYAQKALVEIASASGEVDSATEETLHHRELKHAVFHAMERLPPKTKEVFRLSRFEQCTIREIAHRLNITEKAVEYHVTQALKVMRRELKEYSVPGMGLLTAILLNL